MLSISTNWKYSNKLKPLSVMYIWNYLLVCSQYFTSQGFCPIPNWKLLVASVRNTRNVRVVLSRPIYAKKRDGPSSVDQGFSTASYNSHHVHSILCLSPASYLLNFTRSAYTEPTFNTDCANWLHVINIGTYRITLCCQCCCQLDWRSAHFQAFVQL